MERAELRALVLATGCAEARGAWVFLMDPAWPVAVRNRVRRLLVTLAAAKPSVRRGWLGLPTGGTSGVVKFARHDELTLSAAVKGVSRHFGLRRVNAVGVLLDREIRVRAGEQRPMIEAVADGLHDRLELDEVEDDVARHRLALDRDLDLIVVAVELFAAPVAEDEEVGGAEVEVLLVDADRVALGAVREELHIGSGGHGVAHRSSFRVAASPR